MDCDRRQKNISSGSNQHFSFSCRSERQSQTILGPGYQDNNNGDEPQNRVDETKDEGGTNQWTPPKDAGIPLERFDEEEG